MEYKIVDDIIIVRVDDNEDLIENLKVLFKRLDCCGVIITGLGRVKEVELAFLEYPEKVGQYKQRLFKEAFEVVAMEGNISLFEDFIVHIHVTLADKDYKCIGGHLLSGKVDATLELFIKKLNKIKRMYDEKTGLKIIKI